MTLTQRKKLAKAARELASEYAEGRGPELETWNWCGCAAGQIFKRARIPNKIDIYGIYPSEDLDGSVNGILTEATDRDRGGEPVGFYPRTPGAVVFPLLWLADELESAP